MIGNLVAFLLLTTVHASGRLSHFDKVFFQTLNGLSTNGMVYSAAAITSIGGSSIFWLMIIAVVGVFGLRKRNILPVFELVIALALVTIFTAGVKEIIMHPRPSELLPGFAVIHHPDSGYSYPSGHTARAAAGFSVVTLNSRTWGVIVTLVPPLLVATSRVIVGAHFPLDTLAGLLIGYLSVQISVSLIHRLRAKLPVRISVFDTNRSTLK